MLINIYLHFRPAGYPLICVCTSSCLSSGGPDKGGVGAVRIVAVGGAPRVDEVVGGSVGINHGRFGFEVAFGGWGAVVLVRAEEIGEESLARSDVVRWINNRGGCRGI